MIEAIMKAIQTRIATEVTDLKHVDFDEGQLDYYAEHPPVMFPCCLIQDSSANYTDVSVQHGAIPRNRQNGTVQIVLTVAEQRLTNSSFRTPTTQKDTYFRLSRLVQSIHEAVHGWKPIGDGSMMRVSTQKQKRDDGISVYLVTYSLGLVNC